MIEYWIWLSQCRKVGPRSAMQLLEAFGTPEEIYFADRAQLVQSGCVTPSMLPSLLDKDLLPAKKILSACFEQQISIVTLHEAGYPSRLRTVFDAPIVLYYRGVIPNLDERPVIGIVGARNASAYGVSVAEQMGYSLEKGGCTVVSGMAKGIDGAAMRGALKADNRVIAVLGCGVERIYPRENKDIYQELLSRGCIISEYPPGTAPLSENFPPRNRIISGLSDGILLVEAADKSGSLITVERALEQNRDVFAVPGNIGLVCCEGSNRILKNGAELVQTPADILEVYRCRYPDVLERVEDTPLPKTEETVDIDNSNHYIDLNELKEELSEDAITLLRTLSDGELRMDDLIELSQLSASRVLGLTTLLEVKGYIRRMAGSRFLRIR